MELKHKADLVDCAIRILTPPPDGEVWKWAEKSISLTEDHGEYTGPLRTDLTPWIREPMESCGRTPTVTDVALMWGSQLAKTLTIMVVKCYRLVFIRRSILMVWPNEKLGKAYSKERWQTMVDACEPLRKLKSPERDRYGALDMCYDGPWLNIVGSNSSANISSRPRGDVVQEELDKFAPATEKETSASKNADKRSKSFACPKRLKSSTPTTETGEINLAFSAGDQREWEVECPHCGGFIELIFPQIKWDPDSKIDGDWNYDLVERSAHYECQLCGGIIHDAHKTKMNRSGKWVSRNPSAPRTHRSYHLSSWVAPWPDCTFGRTAVKFLQALADFSMQDFDNNEKGVPSTVEAKKLDWELIYERREEYDQPIPARVALITGFMDVQDDWLEAGLVGWGQKTESWLIEHKIFIGDPALRSVWDEAENWLSKPRRLSIDSLGVDHGGHFPQETAEFVMRCNRKGMRFVHLHKGDNRAWSDVVGRMGWTKKPRCRLHFVGVDSAKLIIHRMLLVDPPEEKGKSKRGLCHFPDWMTDEMAMQLCSEELRTKKIRGEEIQYWYQTRKRNEMWDIYVGAYACLKRLGESWYKKRIAQMLARIKKAGDSPASPDDPPPATPAKQKKKRPPRPRGGFANNW